MRLAAELVKGSLPWFKNIGSNMGGFFFYLATSGVLLMFAEGTRDQGRIHFRELVYGLGILKRPGEVGDSNAAMDQLDRIEAKVDSLTGEKTG